MDLYKFTRAILLSLNIYRQTITSQYFRPVPEEDDIPEVSTRPSFFPLRPGGYNHILCIC